jgi:hypothetical protein
LRSGVSRGRALKEAQVPEIGNRAARHDAPGSHCDHPKEISQMPYQNGISAALVQDQPSSNTRSRAEFSDAIRISWTKGAVGILESSRTLKEAKDQLAPEQFKVMTLPFDSSVARKLLVIANNSLLCAHAHILPPCWTTIYELAQLQDEVLRARIEDGSINTKMQRKDAVALRPREERRTRKKDGQGKPELLKAWLGASRDDQQGVLHHIGTVGLLQLIPEGMRAELEDRLHGREARRASTSNNLATGCTNLLGVALLNAEKGYTHEAIAALNGITRKLKATGRDVRNVEIAITNKKKGSKKNAT